MQHATVSRVTLVLLSLAIGAPLGSAQAEPLVSSDGKDAVVSQWSAQGGDGTVLEVKAEFEPEEVKKAIEANVPGVTVKVDGSKVTVTGMATPSLLLALESVELESGFDDIDDVLDTLSDPSDAESGSSIRATQGAAMADVMGEPKQLLIGRVVRIQRQRFPVVLVKVRLKKVPKPLRKLGLKPGKTITVVPQVRSKDGVIDQTDQLSTLNVGAWYFAKGDRVRIRIGPKKRKGVWLAEAIERRVGKKKR